MPPRLRRPRPPLSPLRCRLGGSLGALLLLTAAAALGALSVTQSLAAPGGQAFGRFGEAVAASPRHLLVGAPRADGASAGSGRVFAYTEAAGTWSHTGDLLPSVTTTAPSDRFGQALATAQRLAVVGAPGSGSGGSAHVFLRAGSGWVELQTLRPGPLGAGSAFGSSIALDGRRLLIGAPAHQGAGAAYLYALNPRTRRFEFRQLLRPETPVAQSEFGAAVALDGKLAVLSAPGQIVGTQPLGAAYLFRLGQSGFAELQQLAPDYPTATDDFAACVALEGQTAVVGAPLRAVGGLSGIGTVLLLEPDPATGAWVLVRELVASNAKADDGFGRAVAIDRDTLLVGAPDTPVGGAAYAFGRDEGGPDAWGEFGRVDNPTGLGDFFGNAVDLSGDVGLVGSPFADAGAASAAGRAEVLAVRRGEPR